LLLVFFIWYGTVRFFVEMLKADNWLLFGVPTAQIFSVAFVLAAIALLAIRHLLRRDPPAQHADSLSQRAPVDPTI